MMRDEYAISTRIVHTKAMLYDRCTIPVIPHFNELSDREKTIVRFYSIEELKWALNESEQLEPAQYPWRCSPKCSECPHYPKPHPILKVDYSVNQDTQKHIDLCIAINEMIDRITILEAKGK